MKKSILGVDAGWMKVGAPDGKTGVVLFNGLRGCAGRCFKDIGVLLADPHDSVREVTDTVVHELLHLWFPKADEATVGSAANAITEAVGSVAKRASKASKRSRARRKR
jgi:hypothetical protein